MCSNFWLLADGSSDLSQAEKEIIVCQGKQIHNIINSLIVKSMVEVSQNFVAFSEYTYFKKEPAIFVLFCLDASLGQSKKDSGRNYLSECIYVQIVK